MVLYREVEEIRKDDNTILTIGTFDGIHLGHQKIIDLVIQKANKNKSRVFVVTFEPHPRKVITNNNSIKLLTTLSEKIELFRKYGVQHLFVINFNKDFSMLTPELFFKNFLVDRIGFKEVVIGYDHHFGKGREGNENKIKELSKLYNFNSTTVEAIKLESEVISSSLVRNLILKGNIGLANKYLNREYSFFGIVVEGEKRGRTLGFPTANLEVDNDKMLPEIGVYSVFVDFCGNIYKGVMNIGHRPTFNNSPNTVIEVHIFEFNETIYGEYLTVYVVERIRGEIKFSSKEELIEQIKKDKTKSLELLLNKKLNY